MQPKRKQHLLPESYLKHWFSQESQAPNKTPMVWVIAKDGVRKRARPPASDAFWRDYFYDAVAVGGERNQDIENAFAELEGKLPHIVDNIIKQKFPTGEEEEALIDFFVACMFLRTEKFMKSIQSAADARARIEDEYSIAYDLDIQGVELRRRNAFPLAISVLWKWLARCLAQWNHLVLVAPPGKFFVTSDTPCFWQTISGFVGLDNFSLEIFLPLASEHALLLTRLLPGDGYVNLTQANVDSFNRRLVQSCRSYFISKSNQTEASWFAAASPMGDGHLDANRKG